MIIETKGNIIDALLNEDINIAFKGCNCFYGFFILD